MAHDEEELFLDRQRSRVVAAVNAIGAAHVVLVWPGGVALWFWSVHLMFQNWGTFWAIVAFCTPPFSVPVAFVMGFFWDTWYYSLGVLAWCIAAIASYTTVNVTEKGKLHVGGWALLLLTWILVAGFAGVLVRDLRAPEPITADEREILIEHAQAVIIVMRSTLTEQPESASQRGDAIRLLKKRFRKYDIERIDEIQHVVEQYLEYEASFLNDLVAQLGSDDFRPSEKTEAKIQQLPPALRELADRDMPTFSVLVERLPSESAKMIGAMMDRRWNNYDRVYRKIFGTALEVPKSVEELENQMHQGPVEDDDDVDRNSSDPGPTALRMWMASPSCFLCSYHRRAFAEVCSTSIAAPPGRARAAPGGIGQTMQQQTMRNIRLSKQLLAVSSSLAREAAPTEGPATSYVLRIPMQDEAQHSDRGSSTEAEFAIKDQEPTNGNFMGRAWHGSTTKEPML